MVRKVYLNPFGPDPLARLGRPDSGRFGQSGWIEPSVPADSSPSSRRRLVPDFNRRLLFLWWFIIAVGLIILISRVLYLQTVASSDLKSIAEGNRIRIQEIKPVRGLLYDRYGNQLVTNIPSFSLAVIPVDLPATAAEQQSVLEALAELSGRPAAEISEQIAGQPPYSYQPVIIQDNLTPDQMLLAEIESRRQPGVILQTNSTRHYGPTTTTASLSHVLGYLSKLNENDLDRLRASDYAYNDAIGKAGIELTYEDTLRGLKGKQQVEVDAVGNTKEVLAYEKPIPGNNLVLTIDQELQVIAEDSLRRSLTRNAKQRGAVVILDPNSGEVLALVSLPTFDNNAFATGISQQDFEQLINDPNQPLFQRAISGEYPSGSTFKLVVAAAALEEGIITPQTSFQSVGGIGVSSWFFPDWKAGGHGWTNVIKGLAESVNTFFYIVGGGYQDFIGLGVDKIRHYAQQFGVNRRLGIDLPNEASGFFPNKEWKEEVKQERWYVGDTYNLSIGQGDILVTPLQVAAWTSVIANGGTLYQPHLVKDVVDDQYNSIKNIEPKILSSNFLSAQTVTTVQRGVRQAVVTGSSQAFAALPLSVAAKTGTAQWSNTRPTHAWLTAFAPFDNPQVVVTVLVEEGGGGSTVAAPVAYDILNWWATHR
jgi:penicillin-binding protein 2